MSLRFRSHRKKKKIIIEREKKGLSLPLNLSTLSSLKSLSDPTDLILTRIDCHGIDRAGSIHISGSVFFEAVDHCIGDAVLVNRTDMLA